MKRREVLERLVKGEISVKEAEAMLMLDYYERLRDVATLDLGREPRKGVPEIVLAEGKSLEDLISIAEKSVEISGRAIITRIEEDKAKIVKEKFGRDHQILYEPRAKVMVVRKAGFNVENTGAVIGILTAGTYDVPVALEAKIVAEELGCEVVSYFDVGVAGLHRVIDPLKEMAKRDVDVIVVVAGREGALPSVVASCVDVPVIAVPTSSGYGFGGRGVSALMSMLQSCSLGMAVVNIDNGAGAGVIAALIANRVATYKINDKQTRRS